MISKTPSPPYYAVIFSSIRTEGDNGYSEMAGKMLELASKVDGFLGVESVREVLGVTVSFWRDLDAIRKWKENTEHKIAMEKGKGEWYKSFKVRIAKVERDYGFDADLNLTV